MGCIGQDEQADLFDVANGQRRTSNPESRYMIAKQIRGALPTEKRLQFGNSVVRDRRHNKRN
ncbi:MAG: hypothetical protein DME94_06515 [Verrucomicrobia bacterium]|nr:MAG: hypothetical protein DME94_06515 [Verrucomicrobiota bacterium]